MTTASSSHPARHGHLVIIGGGEDRTNDKRVLSRFVQLAGGDAARIVVLTAASTQHEAMWETYDRAFGELGVNDRSALQINSREDAADPQLADRILHADGIFMTGGDQRRLLSLIGGTRIDKAMHRALRERGACIGGTSAGASAMSEHMLFDGTREVLPQKGSVHLAAGLGFVRRVVIDQHFSERQRLGRLLSIVAQNPYLLGAGIDEDTALVIEPGRGLEVIGEGAVTLIDGREMLSNLLDIEKDALLELTNVKLHLLPNGVRYRADPTLGEEENDGVRKTPRALIDVVAAVSAMPEPSPESVAQKEMS
ncbi:MAG: cyanophycinase [Vitreoscilla sp.]